MPHRQNDCSTYTTEENRIIYPHRLQNLVQQVPVILFQCELTADGRLGISYMSNGLQVLLGLTPREAISDPTVILRAIFPPDREGILTSIKESAQHHESWSREFRIFSHDEVRWVEAEATVQQYGAVYVYNGYARETTERKLLELKLREAQEELLGMVEDRTLSLMKINAELQNLNNEIKAEISERIVLENKLRESYGLLSLLAADLIHSEERQRRRIATELHDDVVQYLALGKLRIEMSAQNSSPPPDLMKELVDLIVNAIKQIRRICNDLSPPLLYDYGLVEAIDSMGFSLAKDHGFQFEIKGVIHKGLLTNHVRTVLFEAARELLTNVVKHARAKKVRMQLRKKNEIVYLLVMDDGVGMSPSTGNGFGLSHMRQRISFLNGTIRFSSTLDWSTVVTVAVPFTG